MRNNFAEWVDSLEKPSCRNERAVEAYIKTSGCGDMNGNPDWSRIENVLVSWCGWSGVDEDLHWRLSVMWNERSRLAQAERERSK